MISVLHKIGKIELFTKFPTRIGNPGVVTYGYPSESKLNVLFVVVKVKFRYFYSQVL